ELGVDGVVVVGGVAARAATAVAAEIVPEEQLRADTHRLRHEPELDARVVATGRGRSVEIQGLLRPPERLRRPGLPGLGAARREPQPETPRDPLYLRSANAVLHSSSLSVFRAARRRT